jgi:hypothetical protein
MTDVRDHPDYERGYEDRWYGDPRKSDTPEYIAGYEAAAKTEDLFRQAGFTKSGGIWTKSGTVSRSDAN